MYGAHPSSSIEAICLAPSSYKKKKKGLKEDYEADGNNDDDDDDNEIMWLTGLCILGPIS